MKTCVELREERATIISEARKNLEAAEKRDGGLTADDQATFDKAMDAADKMLEQAKRMERLESAETDLDAPQRRESEPLDAESRERRDGERGDRAKVADYRHWLKTGELRQSLRADQARASEFRDVVISTSSSGGYLVTPVQISADIVSIINNLVFIRDLCASAGSITTVTSAQKLGIRKKTVNVDDADWTTEIAAVTPDTGLAFDRRDLEPMLLSKLCKISLRTLMLTADAEKEVTGDLGYKFGVSQEKGFLTGSGSGQPLGVFTASASGISTARDVVAAGATSINGDDLINVKFSIKQNYLQEKSASWIFHRLVVKAIRKIKFSSTAGTAGDQSYVWQPGLTEGAPDRVLDIPYRMSEYAPGTITTGLYTAALGNFRYYRIAQLADVMIQRLVEKYADTHEVGFIGRMFVDGAPVLEEAFARLKQA